MRCFRDNGQNIVRRIDYSLTPASKKMIESIQRQRLRMHSDLLPLYARAFSVSQKKQRFHAANPTHTKTQLTFRTKVLKLLISLDEHVHKKFPRTTSARQHAQYCCVHTLTTHVGTQRTTPRLPLRLLHKYQQCRDSCGLKQNYLSILINKLISPANFESVSINFSTCFTA